MTPEPALLIPTPCCLLNAMYPRWQSTGMSESPHPVHRGDALSELVETIFPRKGWDMSRHKAMSDQMQNNQGNICQKQASVDAQRSFGICIIVMCTDTETDLNLIILSSGKTG